MREVPEGERVCGRCRLVVDVMQLQLLQTPAGGRRTKGCRSPRLRRRVKAVECHYQWRLCPNQQPKEQVGRQ